MTHSGSSEDKCLPKEREAQGLQTRLRHVYSNLRTTFMSTGCKLLAY